MELSHGAHGMTAGDLVKSLARFVRVVVRRREILVLSLLVCGILGALYYATAQREYESSATLTVLQAGTQGNSPELGNQSSIRALMPTYVSLVKADRVMEGAIQHIPSEHRADFLDAPKAAWPAILRSRVTAGTTRDTNVILIGYRSKSAEAAPIIVDAVKTAYLDYMAEEHKDTSLQIYEREQMRLTAIHQERLVKQQQLGVLMAQRGGLMRITDGNMNAAMQRAVSLNQAYVKAHERRIELEAKLDGIRRAIAGGENLQPYVLSLGDTVGREIMLRRLGLGSQDVYLYARTSEQILADRALLQTLQEQGYARNHPRIRELQNRIASREQHLANHNVAFSARIDALTDDLLGPMLEEAARQSLQEAIAHEEAILRDFNATKEETLAFDQLNSQLAMLEDDIQRLKRNEDALHDKLVSIDTYQHGSMLKTTPSLGARVPTHPSTPVLSKTVLLTLFMGVVIGLGIIYIIDLLDDRFRTPEEMQSQVAVPILAMVQRLEPLEGIGAEAIHSCVDPNSTETEAFRTLRTALALQGSDITRLAISSSEPGDGKTTISSNLAATMARSGNRTLLIDADLRRPGLTPMLGLKGERGLSPALRDVEKPASEAAKEHLFVGLGENLDVLPSGPRPTNPAELLAGERFAELLSWAEATYDRVIIDCPPALAVSDPAIVGRLVDGLILVVRPDKNKRRSVIRAVDSLRMLGVQIFGLAVNQVDDSSEYAYYGYDYGYGYAADEMDDEYTTIELESDDKAAA